MTDEDLTEALANRPAPPAASPRVDYRAIRRENARRYAAYLASSTGYPIGRPRWRFVSLDTSRGGSVLLRRLSR